MSSHLDQNFLIELFKICLTDKTILNITIKHLKYEYLPNKEHKFLWEKIVREYELFENTPTIGVLSQEFRGNEGVLKIIHKIKNSSIIGKKDSIINMFEKYIKNSMFIELYTKIGNLHNDGNQDKAIALLDLESKKIVNFTVKDKYYARLFAQYDERAKSRILKEKQLINKIPWSIHPLDYYSKGGINKGTSACILAESGVGKSTMIRWVTGNAAKLGYNCVHFQGEGTEEECFDAYDSLWTGVDLDKLEFGDIEPEIIEKIKKVHTNIIGKGGEVHIKASESFDELSLNDCTDICLDIEKTHGSIDLISFDYAELFRVNGKYYNSESGERKRRLDIANKITTIATTFNSATLTATQASDIKPELKNDPNFYLTRSNISEFKGFVKPFSQFITLNQTQDEYDSGFIRIHCDKFRKYKSKQIFTIAQHLSNSRFYDAKKTLNLLWDGVNNKPIGSNINNDNKKTKK